MARYQSNIKLSLRYDGADFSGYDVQPGKRTVRGEIEKALKKIYKKRIKFFASSRTDAGVHALANVISFKPPFDIPAKRLVAALNSVLPMDIRVTMDDRRWTRDEFNARFDAKSKVYEYLIYNGKIMPPHLRRIAWQVKPKLNLAAMRKAAKYLVGKHDFSSFCAGGGDDKDFVRIIHSFDIGHLTFVIWGGVKYRLIRFRVTGNGFLYKMVRNMVGTLVDVGLGRAKGDDVKRILLAKNRKSAGRTAPAHGLCLVKVKY